MPDKQQVSIGAFAAAFGDLERRPTQIPGFDALWQATAPGTDFAALGASTFRKMSGPVEEYVVDSVRQTLDLGAVRPEDVDQVVFATSDARLASFGPDWSVRVLNALGLTACVPVILSFQQCCSALVALRHAWDQFADPDVQHVILVSLDFVPEDRDRVRDFALFGDAVATCLLSRHGSGPLRLAASAVEVDPAGLAGQDSFLSRQKVAQTALTRVLSHSDIGLEGVTSIFPTNLYEPVTLFNASIAGIPREKLHFAEPLRSYGHCGNADWMINLIDYERTAGIHPGEVYLAQASAPGFFACGLLNAT